MKTALQYFAVIFFFAAGLIWICFPVQSFEEISIIAAIVAIVSLGIFLFWATDRLLVREVNTIDQLLNKNTAYAIFLLAIALIICTGIISAVLLFYS